MGFSFFLLWQTFSSASTPAVTMLLCFRPQMNCLKVTLIHKLIIINNYCFADIVHLNWFSHCFLLYTGKMGLDGSTLKLNFKGKNSIDQNKEIHTVTSALCHSFFDWHKDLKDSDFEEVDVFVKTLHKVNEKLPAHPLKGNLSIHQSIHLSINPSIPPPINSFFSVCVAGASNAYNEELLKKLNDSVKSKHQPTTFSNPNSLSIDLFIWV